MIYAPRDEDELDVVMQIIRAAVGWVSGQRLPGPNEDDANFAHAFEDDNGTAPFDPKNDEVSKPDANDTERGLVAEVGRQVMEVA